VRSFRFGVNFRDDDGWLDFCRRAERWGYDVLLAPDHLGAAAPFAMLAAAAAVTERVRLGTYVVNVPFWNPSMLAREFATVDRLSGGRVEIGLGSGHMKSEFDAAGIEWQPFDARAQRVVAMVDELDRLFADGGQEPLPVQRPRPPLLIGGAGDRLLRLAAERADTMAYSGIFQVKGAPPGTFRPATPEELDERVAFFRSHAGPRADEVEAGLLLQHVAITDDPLEYLKGLWPDAPVEDYLTSPVLLLGTLDELVEQVLALRERYGVTYLATHQPSAEAFAQVIEQIRFAG
jgi:probable F420-dependent oxidoreductase